MLNKFALFLFLLFLAAQPAVAQILVPATSEDINEFDRQIAEQNKRAPEKKESNQKGFGSSVAEEAKKLKDSDSSKDFGKWVNSQRKKSDQGRPSSEGGEAGKNSSAPGQSGGHPGKGKNKNR